MVRESSRIAVAVICFFGTGFAFSQNSLSIGTAEVDGLVPAVIDVTMTNAKDSVEGFVLSISYDTTALSIRDVAVAGTVTGTTGAELVVPQIFEAQGGFTLGVVLDFNEPFVGQEIPAGSDQRVATFVAFPDVFPGPPPEPPIVVDLVFTDGAFNSPPLDNILVINGMSVGAAQGLALNNGQLTINAPAPDGLTIESVVIDSAILGLGPNSAPARVLMANQSGPVQGFVVAIAHDDAVVDLTDINLDGTVTDAVGAEFIVPDLNPAGGTGGTLGVVLDFDPPFSGQTIPMGADNHIATFVYRCQNEITYGSGDPRPRAEVSNLTFVSGVLDTPPLDNIIVVGGFSIHPSLQHGTFTCLPVLVPDVLSPQFFCGVMDPAGGIVDPEGFLGQTIPLSFYYIEGEDPNPFDGIPQCVGRNIQAFQLALNFDCNLTVLEDSFTVQNSILGAIGAEFINVNIDNDSDDGDGCDLTIGILLDALPPFNRQTAPPTCSPLLIGSIDALIEETAPCGGCLPVEFRNGVDGGENIPLNNLIVVDNRSVQFFPTFDCNVCVNPVPVFTRGDCNGDEKVDFADANTINAVLYQGIRVPCFDACDANDDGNLDLGDRSFLLAFISSSGPPPPDPGPNPLNPGPDPTEDRLDCAGGVCP